MLAVAALSGGLIGGGVVHFLGSDDGKEPDEQGRSQRSELLKAAQTSMPEDETDDEVTRRLRTLEHRLSVVTAALQKNKDADFARGGDEAEPQEESERTDSTDVADPVFEAAVLDIMDRERERKAEEQASWRKGLNTERGRRYAGELKASLGLDSEQEAAIAQAVADYFSEMTALREDDSPNRPATRNEWRAFREKMNQEADAKLKAILGAEQYRKYEQLDPDDQLGWGRRRSENRDSQR